jgi:hypothetical protein
MEVAMNDADRISWRQVTALVTAFAFGMSSSLAASFQTQSAAPPESQVRIEHDPLTCVTTVIAPQVDARMLPGQQLSTSYVYFRASGTPYFYYLIMTGTPPDQQATMPRPLPETKSIDYYVQATDRASMSRKTPDYLPQVMPGDVCTAKGMIVGPEGAGLTIGLTDAKQPPLPPGFNKDDIAKIILVTGAIVTVAAAMQMFGGGATAAGASGTAGGATGTGTGAGAGAGAGGGAAAGGGISTGVIVAGAAAVAAGVAVAVSNNHGSKSPSPTPTPVVNHFVEVDATWSGIGNIDVQLINPSGQMVGQTIPAGCDATGASRTERVLLQGTNLPTGSYQVRLVANSCGASTPPVIATLLTVQTDTGPKCSSAFVNVPLGTTVPGCSFTLP